VAAAGANTAPPGLIYTWQTTPSPKLNITPTAGGLVVSWIVPSMPFQLQAKSNLVTGDWTDVTLTPTLSYTNLHHEVVLPVSSDRRFFRLKSL
jgi:hypothetical protein